MIFSYCSEVDKRSMTQKMVASLDKVSFRPHPFLKYHHYWVIHDVLYSVRHLMNGWGLKYTFLPHPNPYIFIYKYNTFCRQHCTQQIPVSGIPYSPSGREDSGHQRASQRKVPTREATHSWLVCSIDIVIFSYPYFSLFFIFFITIFSFFFFSFFIGIFLLLFIFSVTFFIGTFLHLFKLFFSFLFFLKIR